MTIFNTSTLDNNRLVELIKIINNENLFYILESNIIKIELLENDKVIRFLEFNEIFGEEI